MNSRHSLAVLFAAGALLLGGCNYDFPLTAKPTHKVDARLLGDWTAVDKESGTPDRMKVRKLDDSTYIIAYDHDLYRAFHSDFARTQFVSVQDLQSDERKYVYFVWQLSADGTQLGLKAINARVIPEKTPDRETMQKLLEKNLGNPGLFGEEMQFTRDKPAKF